MLLLHSRHKRLIRGFYEGAKIIDGVIEL